MNVHLMSKATLGIVHNVNLQAFGENTIDV